MQTELILATLALLAPAVAFSQQDAQPEPQQQPASTMPTLQYPLAQNGKYWFLVSKADGTWRVDRGANGAKGEQISNIEHEGQEIITVSWDAKYFAPWWPGEQSAKTGASNKGADGVSYHFDRGSFQCPPALSKDSGFTYTPCKNSALTKINAGMTAGRALASVITLGLAGGKNVDLDKDQLAKLAIDINIVESVKQVNGGKIGSQYPIMLVTKVNGAIEKRGYQLDLRSCEGMMRGVGEKILATTRAQTIQYVCTDEDTPVLTNPGSVQWTQFVPYVRPPPSPQQLAYAAAEVAEAKRRANLAQQEAAKNQAEMPKKRKLGAEICNDFEGKTFVGYVEAVADEKVKIRVVGAVFNPNPDIQNGKRNEVTNIPERILWDLPSRWYLCGTN